MNFVISGLPGAQVLVSRAMASGECVCTSKISVKKAYSEKDLIYI